MINCLCGSLQPFEICCGKYLSGETAPTPEALMRSRYTAYVKGDLDYIKNTSAGEARLLFDAPKLSKSLQKTEWVSLNILGIESGTSPDTVGYITFEVQFKENGQMFTQTERSEFRRIGQAWRYWRGEFDIQNTSDSKTKIGRNHLCHCGSGKKFKKCCGA